MHCITNALSTAGLCLLHGTSGELLHKLVPNTAWTHPHMISSTPRGNFLVHYADQKGCLAVFTCNGKQLAYRSLNEPALVSSPFCYFPGLHFTILINSYHNCRQCPCQVMVSMLLSEVSVVQRMCWTPTHSA